MHRLEGYRRGRIKDTAKELSVNKDTEALFLHRFLAAVFPALRPAKETLQTASSKWSGAGPRKQSPLGIWSLRDL